MAQHLDSVSDDYEHELKCAKALSQLKIGWSPKDGSSNVILRSTLMLDSSFRELSRSNR